MEREATPARDAPAADAGEPRTVAPAARGVPAGARHALTLQARFGNRATARLLAASRTQAPGPSLQRAVDPAKLAALKAWGSSWKGTWQSTSAGVTHVLGDLETGNLFDTEDPDLEKNPGAGSITVSTLIERLHTIDGQVRGHYRELAYAHKHIVKAGRGVQVGAGDPHPDEPTKKLGGDVRVERPKRKAKTLQFKVVSSPSPDQVGKVMLKAAQQLTGKGGELPGKDDERVIDVTIRSPRNPWPYDDLAAVTNDPAAFGATAAAKLNATKAPAYASVTRVKVNYDAPLADRPHQIAQLVIERNGDGWDLKSAETVPQQSARRAAKAAPVVQRVFDKAKAGEIRKWVDDSASAADELKRFVDTLHDKLETGDFEDSDARAGQDKAHINLRLLQERLAQVEAQARGHRFELSYAHKHAAKGGRTIWVGAQPALKGKDKRGGDARVGRPDRGSKTLQFKVVSTNDEDRVREVLTKAGEQLAGAHGERPEKDDARVAYIVIANPDNPWPFRAEGRKRKAGDPEEKTSLEYGVQAAAKLAGYQGVAAGADVVKVTYDPPRKTSGQRALAQIVIRSGEGAGTWALEAFREVAAAAASSSSSSSFSSQPLRPATVVHASGRNPPDALAQLARKPGTAVTLLVREHVVWPFGRKPRGPSSGELQTALTEKGAEVLASAPPGSGFNVEWAEPVELSDGQVQRAVVRLEASGVRVEMEVAHPMTDADAGAGAPAEGKRRRTEVAAPPAPDAGGGGASGP